MSFKQLVAATACAGCALLLASVALRSKSKPAQPKLKEEAEVTTRAHLARNDLHRGDLLWITEAHGGTDADFTDVAEDASRPALPKTCTEATAVDPRVSSLPWIADFWTEEEDEARGQPTTLQPAWSLWIAEAIGGKEREAPQLLSDHAGEGEGGEKADDGEREEPMEWELYAAAWLGNAVEVRLLLEHGADQPATIDDEATPLFYM
ncbi:hypothetical protein T484DRAFT_1833962 [Baffinella frigidus]|nr:hypothetical protein T484DRAFT_1833962 [Cryptophyta sp. CCMP2293]